jgi:hypothetical protein
MQEKKEKWVFCYWDETHFEEDKTINNKSTGNDKNKSNTGREKGFGETKRSNKISTGN